MKKKILNRALTGFPYGICVVFVGTLLLSLFNGGGVYLSAAPELIAQCGSELNAMLLQAGICGLLGSVLSASSVIWNIKKWSTLQKTIIGFLIAAVAIFPVYYFLYWMERTWSTFFLYLLMFLVVYVIFSLLDYHGYKKRLERQEKAKQTPA